MKALLIALNLTLVACALTATLLHRAGVGGEGQPDSFKVYKKRLATLSETIDATLVYQRRNPDDRNASSIWFKAIDADRPTQLAKVGRLPRWSPDGKSVVFLQGDTISLVDRDSRRVTEVITLPGVEAASFADENTLTACGRSDGGWIRRIDLATSETEDLLTGHPFTQAEVVPDTPYIAASIRGGSGGNFSFRFTVPGGEYERLKSGAPVSLSPSADRILVTRTSLREAEIIDVEQCDVIGQISAPTDRRMVNHRWSNHAEYAVGISKDFGNNIFICHLPTNQAIQATKTGDTNYPDLWINQ